MKRKIIGGLLIFGPSVWILWNAFDRFGSSGLLTTVKSLVPIVAIMFGVSLLTDRTGEKQN